MKDYILFYFACKIFKIKLEKVRAESPKDYSPGQRPGTLYK